RLPMQSASLTNIIEISELSKSYRIWKDPAARLRAPMLLTGARIVPRVGPLKKVQENLAQRARECSRTFMALQPITLSIPRGQCVGIVGRNGSGKSTLLQLICGILQPSTGTARVGGRIAALLELGSGFNPEFTGRENVFLNAS